MYENLASNMLTTRFISKEPSAIILHLVSKETYMSFFGFFVLFLFPVFFFFTNSILRVSGMESIIRCYFCIRESNFFLLIKLGATVL